MTPIAITLVGMTPLLCGRPVPDAVPDDRDPATQAAERLYRDVTGEPVIPGFNLFRCVTGALHVGDQRAADLVHCLGIADQAVPIRSAQGWTVDSRWVRHPATQQWRRCHRPRFADWTLTCTLLVDRDALPLVDARSRVELAGMRIGLGDFRPARGGPFGRFTLTTWEPVA